tara:strand:- start:1567 stop:1668 length:102 start_codon:yes stop_codon:yes gene_type:complete
MIQIAIRDEFNQADPKSDFQQVIRRYERVPLRH